MVSFRSRSICLDEVSQKLLHLLVALGGYCTALQAQELVARGAQVRSRLKMLERLGFLRRITKYPVVYQVTKSTTRLLGQDSSSRRRHTLETVQARLLGVHFYLQARGWPAEFVLDHQEKVAYFSDCAGCPLSALPQRGGRLYMREHLLFWQPDGRMGIAMIDVPDPKVLTRLKVFIRDYLPLLRHFRTEPDLFIVTADKERCQLYERLLKRHRTIHELGLGELSRHIKPYCVRPPVPTITEMSWPKADEHESYLEVKGEARSQSPSHATNRPIVESIS